MRVIVYLGRNIVNQKGYVGVTRTGMKIRYANHRKLARSLTVKRTLFAKAIAKYRPEMFRFSTLMVFDNEPDAYAHETPLIAKYGTLAPHGYNLSTGGRVPSGWIRTPEWRAKARKILDIGRAKRNRAVVCLDDGATFSTMREASLHYGIVYTQIKSVCAGREISARGLHFAFSTRPIPKKVRKTMIVAVERRRAANFGAGGRSRSRGVVCVTDGRRFESGAAAARAYGIHVMRVSQICNAGGTTETGLRFRFEDSPEVIKPRMRRGPTGRRIVCLDDGREFESCGDVAKNYGARAPNIIMVCDGRRRSASGYRFAWA